MATEFPIVPSYKNIEKLFDAIQKAEVPDRLSFEVIKKLGLTSSTDRPLVPLLRKLGFIGANSEPLEPYRDLKGDGWRIVLGSQLRQLYKELYQIDPEIHDRQPNEIKAAIARVTGKDDKTVDKMYHLFNAMASKVTWGVSKKATKPTVEVLPAPDEPDERGRADGRKLDFVYTIQLQLPPTRDIAIYNALFKSLKEHLLD